MEIREHVPCRSWQTTETFHRRSGQVRFASQNGCNAGRYGLVGSKDRNEAGRPVERLLQASSEMGCTSGITVWSERGDCIWETPRTSSRSPNSYLSFQVSSTVPGLCSSPWPLLTCLVWSLCECSIHSFQPSLGSQTCSSLGHLGSKLTLKLF